MLYLNLLHDLKLRIYLIFLQMLKHARRIRLKSIEIFMLSFYFALHSLSRK